MRGLFTFVSGFGGLQAPIFERLFTGGDDSIRGFGLRDVSPLTLLTTRSLSAEGNPVFVSRPVAVGGDTLALYNAEYRIPLVGPFTLALFFDIGRTWVWKESQLRIGDTAVTDPYKFENGAFRSLRPGEPIELIPGTSKIRSSMGVEIQVILPILNAPFRLILSHNPNRLETIIARPEGGFFRLRENHGDIRVSVGRTF
jgi:outer membrane protein insertion porin family